MIRLHVNDEMGRLCVAAHELFKAWGSHFLGRIEKSK